LFQHNGAIAGWRNGRVRRALLDQLNDELYEYAVRNGASDSIVAFALFLNQMECGTDARYSAAALQDMLLRTIALILETTMACLIAAEAEASKMKASGMVNAPKDDVFLLNFVLTDGETLIATKYAHGLGNPDAPAASLYFGAASAYEPAAIDTATGTGDYMFSYTAANRSGVVIVASEPLTSNPCDWVSLPRNSILVVTGNQHLLVERLPTDFSQMMSTLKTSNMKRDANCGRTGIAAALASLLPSTPLGRALDLRNPSPAGDPEQIDLVAPFAQRKNASEATQQELENKLAVANHDDECLELREPDQIFQTVQSQVLCMDDLQVWNGCESNGLSLPNEIQQRGKVPIIQDLRTQKMILLCGTGQGHLLAWDRVSGSLWHSCKISTEGRDILDIVQWRPDGNGLGSLVSERDRDSCVFTACTATDNSVRMHRWTENGPQLEAEFFCGTDTGHPLCLATDKDFIYIGFQDCSVRRLSANKLVSERIMLTNAAMNQDHRNYESLRSALLTSLSCGSTETSVCVVGAGDREASNSWQHCGPVHCLAIHSSTCSLFSGSGDGTIGAWNTKNGTKKAVLRGHRGAVLALKVDQETDTLYSGSRDRHIRVWDVGRCASYVCRRALMSWDYHRDDICALELSELFLVSGSTDGVIVLWNRIDLVPLALLSLPDDARLASLSVARVTAVSHQMEFPEFDSMLYAAGTAGHIYAWHLGSSSRLFQHIYRDSLNDAVTGGDSAAHIEPVSLELNLTGLSLANAQSPRAFPLRSPRLNFYDFESPSIAAFERALRTLIRFRSVSAELNPSNFRDECFRCARWLSHLLESLGADVRIAQPVDGKNPLILARLTNVIARTKRIQRQAASVDSLAGLSRPAARDIGNIHNQTIVFYGHYDVVPASREDGWSHDPFDLHVVDGYFHGRGVTDNKGPILAMIFAVADLMQQQRQLAASSALAPRTEAIMEAEDQPTRIIDYQDSLSGQLAGDSNNPQHTSQALSTTVVLVLDGEGEAASAGFRETITAYKDWIAGNDTVRNAGCASESQTGEGTSRGTDSAEIVCVLHANSLWVDDTRPCITYGMRGQILLSVEVIGPARNLHSGFDGGAIVEPTVDLLGILSTLTDAKGTPIVPGFYEEVRELTEQERDWYRAIQFDKQAYMKQLGVSRLATDSETDLLQRRWSQPYLSVTSLSTSADAGLGQMRSAKDASMRSGVVSALIPQCAQATIAVRTVPNQNPDKLRAAIERHLRFEFEKRRSPNQLRITCTKRGDWWHGDIDGERFPARHGQVLIERGRARQRVFAVTERAIERVWGMRPLYVREGGSMPLTAWLEDILEAPAIHLPLGQASDAPHLPNERIRALNLFNGRRVMAEMMRALAEPG
jgi:acetylornithine deacetylase/succinyl-diaminopimelate desuccinylase-like protein/predicted glutamine amidotransferase